ncbi:ECF transporter S component [Coprococcus sp. AF27-8]|nr:ECF transporter S component [Coprococcus sp. AF27-8]
MSTNVAEKTKVNTRTLVQIGMLSALAIILMQFEIPLPFAPAFYKIDFSEVPVLIGCFSMGPFAGILIELIKVILNVAIKGTMTMGIGDAANFLIGCAFCVPAALIYQKKRTKSGAVTGMVVGTVIMTILGCVLNAYILLPVYAKAFEMPLDALVSMGTEVNGAITGLMTFVLFAVAPFNLLKGILVSLIVFFVYKKIRQVLL